MRWYILLFLMFFFTLTGKSQKTNDKLAVIAYYTGNETVIDSFEVQKLTHIIFSFCHLKGNRLFVNNARDSATIHKLVSLKQKFPALKIMLSLGGWGGCEFCSQVFSTKAGRSEFAESVKELTDYFDSDGIDLDWEYPVISGYPGHVYQAGDKSNFTALVKQLRKKLGRHQVISFAAGGFTSYLLQSIEWKKVMRRVDFVNLMSYDLVSGFATTTGHHTPLYSNATQTESADHAVNILDSLGVPKNKIVIGAAFYARTWENVENINNGLYQPGKFKSFIPFNKFDSVLVADSGFVFYHDAIASATHAYNASQKIFATFDDPASIKAKTRYAIDKGLKGIMFWQLTLDKQRGGLVDAISNIKNNKE
jgi:chitinase